MDSNFINNGRYKIVKKMHSEKGYACYKAIDISDAQQQEVIINCYFSDGIIKHIVPLFHQLEKLGFKDYLGCFTGNGFFAGVFVKNKGNDIDDDFQLDGSGIEERVSYVESLLHKVLENSLIDKYILYNLLDKKNILLLYDRKEVFFNYMIYSKVDKVDVNKRLSYLLELFLKRSWLSTNEQIEFLDALINNEYAGISQIYSKWREIKDIIIKDDKSPRLLKKIGRFIKRKLKEFKKKRSVEFTIR